MAYRKDGRKEIWQGLLAKKGLARRGEKIQKKKRWGAPFLIFSTADLAAGFAVKQGDEKGGYYNRSTQNSHFLTI